MGGLNDPNQLQALDLREVTFIDLISSSAIDLHSRLFMVRTLVTTYDKLDVLMSSYHSSGDSVFNQVTTLIIDNRWHSDDNFGADWLSAIVFNNVTHLKLLHFGSGDGDDAFPKQSFLRLLSAFPNLEGLSLNEIYIEGFRKADAQQIHEMLPNLRTLCLKREHPDVLSVCSKPLNAVSIWRAIPSDCVFDDWEEIEIAVHNVWTFKPSPVLKRACLQLADLFNQEIDIAGGRKVIFDLLQSRSLEQLIVVLQCDALGDICGAFERAIFSRDDDAKGRLCCKLVIRGDVTLEYADILCQISRIVNQLYSSGITEYLFLCNFENSVNTLEDRSWNKQMEKFIARNGARFDVTFSRHNILISNKNCKLSGCIQGYIWDGWLIKKLTRES